MFVIKIIMHCFTYTFTENNFPWLFCRDLYSSTRQTFKWDNIDKWLYLKNSMAENSFMGCLKYLMDKFRKGLVVWLDKWQTKHDHELNYLFYSEQIRSKHTYIHSLKVLAWMWHTYLSKQSYLPSHIFGFCTIWQALAPLQDW